MSVAETQDHVLRIRRGGRDIEGRWRLADGQVEVECPFGVDRSPLQPGGPRRIAEMLLARLAFLAMAEERA